ncbi:MAG: 4-(cytidine 5'-diphospho)-2-C-methyl-D-erythritol kinase [Candidatus Omnitrophica bacterium]|nr:4-(cytidine 5'-diphospho)-2-C-methyl-D-erythritol kinase [Candidatus Omnitrophota bacterium]
MVSPLVESRTKRSTCAGRRLVIKSPAKINLYLNLLGRYPVPTPSGIQSYHEIESIVERISLCDRIVIAVRADRRITFVSDCSDLPARKNTCVQAARLMQKEYGISAGFDICLKKNIPVGAGLGGGSSNAASVILGICSLLGLQLSRDRLFLLGEQIGSDVNFFLAQTPFAVMRGRGEKISPFQGHRFLHTVVWPGVYCSTKKVYARVTRKLTKIFDNVKILRYAIKNGDVQLSQRTAFNALEQPALEAYPGLRRAKCCLHGIDRYVRISGSGSALYTMGAKRISSSFRLHNFAVYRVHTF